MELTEKQKSTLRRNNAESNAVTREAIRDALYILMRTKNFDDITISDIINKSGVSRSAFYRNYKTKIDILHDTVEEICNSYVVGVSYSLEGNWELAFSILRKNKGKLDLIFQAGLEHHLLDELNKNLDYQSGKDFQTAMNNGLIYNVLTYWSKCGMKDTDRAAAKQVVEAYQSIIQELGKYS